MSVLLSIHRKLEYYALYSMIYMVAVVMIDNLFADILLFWNPPGGLTFAFSFGQSFPSAEDKADP